MSTPDPRAQLEKALGGWRGGIESALPAFAFLVMYQLGGRDLQRALYAAGGVALIATVLRILRRSSLQYVVSGLFGVAISAYFVTRTGKAEDFFLPGLLVNVAWGSVYLLSILVRYPVIGLFLGAIEGQPLKWVRDADRRRAAAFATWLWVAMFALRLAVELPMYFAGAINALGVAKLALGWPPYLLVIYLTYLIVRPFYAEPVGEDLV